MNDYVVIEYNGEQVSVPKEVADFLEQDRKREQAQKKQDQRHLSKSEFETVLSGSDCVRRPVEDAVLRNLRLENLRKAIANLDDKDQAMISLRYSGELTMEEIGKVSDISKMAVSKRLKKRQGCLRKRAWTSQSFTKSWGALSYDRAPQIFLRTFLFSGLQTRSECPYK